ncbi:unnamed protein product, partial [Mesorhabditis spiculigera]
MKPRPADGQWDWRGNLTAWADMWSDQAKLEQQIIADAEATLLGQIFHFVHPNYWGYVHKECLELNGTYSQFTNPMLGSVYLVTGFTYELIYIPVLIAMMNKEFFQHACYKIMFAMGIMDIISLVPNALLAGYYLFVGGSICTYPLLNVWLGFIAYAFWCGYCSCAILLGLNRTLDFGWPRLAESLFKDWRVYVWLGLGPVGYVMFVLLTDVPSQFNPIMGGYFFDIDIFKPMEVMMVSFLVRLYRKSSVGVSTMQKVVVIQCLSICIVMMIASGIYCFMQFIPVPVFFVVISTMMWQFSNGAPGVMYVVVNRSIRTAVLTMLGIRKDTKTGHLASTASGNKVGSVSTAKKDKDSEAVEDKF